MTNEEAIKALEDMRQELIWRSQTPAYLNEEERQHIICLQIEVYKKAIDALKQTQWIPCSEFPPFNDSVLITDFDHWIDIGYFDGCSWHYRDAVGNPQVTAWMPLPEPYREEEA